MHGGGSKSGFSTKRCCVSINSEPKCVYTSILGKKSHYPFILEREDNAIQNKTHHFSYEYYWKKLGNRIYRVSSPYSLLLVLDRYLHF